jgi:starch-binding outer membrane protein SusE/F
MNKKLILYLTFIGLISLLSGCEKDGKNVIMLADPIAPTIQTVPDLTLQRTHGTDSLEFVGTPVDPGFTASATYFLEACASGNNFQDSVVLLTDIQDLSMKITVSDLNGILLKKFPGDQVSSVDLRIRAVLSVDAGTGAKPMIYKSEITTSNVTVYGLPRLDLINSGVTQKIESPLGNGKYSGYVKLDKTKPFTLKDPDANIVYGNVAAGKLGITNTGITPSDNGWFKLSADTQALTYSMDAYMVGLIGSATPNGWNTPDQKMDYDAKTGTWKITITLIDGEIKFRLNDGWAWNLGGTTNNLTQGGANIPVTAGNYTITLTIINNTTGTCTIVKN